MRRRLGVELIQKPRLMRVNQHPRPRQQVLPRPGQRDRTGAPVAFCQVLHQPTFVAHLLERPRRRGAGDADILGDTGGRGDAFQRDTGQNAPFQPCQPKLRKLCIQTGTHNRGQPRHAKAQPVVQTIGGSG